MAAAGRSLTPRANLAPSVLLELERGRIPAMLAERVRAFVGGASSESFDELALELFRERYRRDEAFRALCEERQATPARTTDWREIPAVPVEGRTGADPGQEGPAPGEGLSPGHLELRRAVIDRSFPGACLTGLGRPPVLSLIPTDTARAEPRLAMLADRVLEAWAAPTSATAVTRRGVEAAQARSFLAARQRDRQPTLILATTATLAQLLEALVRRGLRFRLPPGSRVVEAGGADHDGRELLGRLADGLALPPQETLLAWGAAGSPTLLYARRDRRSEPRPFRTPPWVRARVLDPRTRAELPAGDEGELALFDLAAPNGGASLLTGERAIAAGDGFRLTGLGSSPEA